MSERKEMSTEARSLLAAVLCLLVIGAWSLIYKPPPTPVNINPAPAIPAAPAQTVPSASSKAAAHVPTPVAMRAAGEERSIIIESDLYRVEISNRGAVVHSWLLKKFSDDNKPPRTLDLVHRRRRAESRQLAVFRHAG